MVGYYDKLTQAGFFDLQEDMALVTDPAAISSSTHITELLQAKATLAIASHAAEYSYQPLFMYYALENRSGSLFSIYMSSFYRCQLIFAVP